VFYYSTVLAAWRWRWRCAAAAAAAAAVAARWGRWRSSAATCAASTAISTSDSTPTFDSYPSRSLAWSTHANPYSWPFLTPRPRSLGCRSAACWFPSLPASVPALSSGGRASLGLPPDVFPVARRRRLVERRLSSHSFALRCRCSVLPVCSGVGASGAAGVAAPCHQLPRTTGGARCTATAGAVCAAVGSASSALLPIHAGTRSSHA